MRITGLKGLLLAAGLTLSGAMLPGVAVAQQPAPLATPIMDNPVPSAAGAAVAPTQNAETTLTQLDGAPVLTPGEAIGKPDPARIGIQPQVTKNGQRAYWFHNVILFPLITIISLFVLALLVWVVIRYRQAANPVPSKTSHNTFIEVVWTLVPVLILVAIAVPSIGLLAAQYKPAPAGAVTLKAIGNQWYWTYQYPDNGGFEITANMLKERDQVAAGERARTDVDGPRLLATDNRIVLPVGVPIRLITTSNDVIHSWAVPSFWIKLDAVPGRLNETSFTIEKPGLYFGQCSELCGARHAFMPIAVEAVAPAEFAAWVRAKGGTMPGQAAPSGAVIPQPAADSVDDTSTPLSNTVATGAATENVTAVSTTSPQGATANPAGPGNVDQ